MLKIAKVTTRRWSRADLNRRQKSRIYFFPKGETVLENFFVGRRNRPYEEYRKLLPQVYAEIDATAKAFNRMELKAKWSQKAGCPCGCSPGFILSDMLTEDDTWYGAFDVYVDVEEAGV